jgi:hypothetical protein
MNAAAERAALIKRRNSSPGVPTGSAGSRLVVDIRDASGGVGATGRARSGGGPRGRLSAKPGTAGATVCTATDARNEWLEGYGFSEI